jgi:hypothetical protein
MNCLEFRRRLGSEPASTQADFVAHRSGCGFCSAAQARADEFESRIRRALDVPVPASLADRILLAQTTQLRHGLRHRRRGVAVIALAAAASVVVALLAVNRPQSAMPELAGMVAEHLREHVVSASDADRPVPSADVIEAFAARGVSIASVPEGVNYVHKCPAGPYRTVHMVMPEREGLVSVVYVADAKASGRTDFDHAGIRGRELPLGKGSLIMLAQSDDSFDAIEGAWRSVLGEAVAQKTDAHAPAAAIRIAGAAIWKAHATVAAP